MRIAKDPFTPHVGAGSGLAYSNGFPLSIEGSAPADFRGRKPTVSVQPAADLRGRAGEGERAGRGIRGRAEARRDRVSRGVAVYGCGPRGAPGGVAREAGGEPGEGAEIARTRRVELGRELPVDKAGGQVNLLRARAAAVNAAERPRIRRAKSGGDARVRRGRSGAARRRKSALCRRFPRPKRRRSARSRAITS